MDWYIAPQWRREPHVKHTIRGHMTDSLKLGTYRHIIILLRTIIYLSLTKQKYRSPIKIVKRIEFKVHYY